LTGLPIAQSVAGLIQLFQLLLGFFLKARVVFGQAVRMPNKRQVLISLIHLFKGGTGL
jgi:hypothetical protein